MELRLLGVGGDLATHPVAKHGLQFVIYRPHAGADDNLPLPVFNLRAQGAVKRLKGLQVCLAIVLQVEPQPCNAVRCHNNVIGAAHELEDTSGQFLLVCHNNHSYPRSSPLVAMHFWYQ